MGPLTAALLLSQAPPPVEVSLTRRVRGLDFAGTRSANQMYMPSSAPLSKEAPAGVKRTPVEWGEIWFGSVRLGNGPQNTFLIALQAKGDDSKLFLDFNQNGDFLDDPVAEWAKLPPRTDGQPPSWQGTNVFSASYEAGGKTRRAPYGLNLYWSPGRTQINYFRATTLVGQAKIDGKDVSIRVLEDGNDGVFNRRFDLSEDDASLRPVSIVLNEARKDARGTFDFEGINYLAELSPDGSRLRLTPTYRVVRSTAPPPAQQRPLLAKGTPAPDFVAHAPNGDPVRLSDHKGKVVVLKFWATWCGPCIASMPHYQELFTKTEGQDVFLFALCVSDEKAAFDRWVPANRSKYTFPVFFDPAGRTPNQAISSRLYNVSGIPTVYIIDKEGKVAESIVGYSDGDKRVDQALARLGVKL